MSRAKENAGFVCAHCGQVVHPLTNGSFRNHCPSCLWSVHVDDKPGDRAVNCRALMQPVGVELSKKGWRLVHKCLRCRVVRVNRIAERTVQPDDIDALVRLVETQHGQQLAGH